MVGGGPSIDHLCCVPSAFHLPHHQRKHTLSLSGIPRIRKNRSSQLLTSRFDSSTTQDALTSTTPSPLHFLSSEERNNVETLVQQRSDARWKGDYDRADELRQSLDDISIDVPWSRILQSTILDITQTADLTGSVTCKVIVTDLPRSKGGRSTWELIPNDNPALHTNSQSQDNVLQLAHAALGLAVSASERGEDVNEDDLNSIVERAENRLKQLKQRKVLSSFLPETALAGELHGRKAADSALWFALAGTQSSTVYDELVDITTDELLRFGNKPSCRAKDILHIVERVAMCGIVGSASQRLYRVAADCLETKLSGTSDTTNDESRDDTIDYEEESDGSIDYQDVINSLRDSSFGLHSDRPLLGLWRFSTRQRKQRSFFQNAARHYDGRFRDTKSAEQSQSVGGDKLDQYDWPAMFEDPTNPLVVDVGCGMGVSTLGLASLSTDEVQSTNNGIQMDWSGCNYVGVDLSRLAIRYASGVSGRSSLSSHLRFIVDQAEECLEKIRDSYPGKVQLIMVQFPTPFRFQYASEEEDEEKGYNAQLPDTASGDFMVSEKLLSEIHAVLTQTEGKLLIQSNCEDVAVHMQNIAVNNCGFEPVTFVEAVSSLSDSQKRAQDWVTLGGERAIGNNWSGSPLLPLKGRTETEVACLLNSKPVHRCLLVPK